LRPLVVAAWRKFWLKAMKTYSFEEIFALGHEDLQLERKLGLRP
jgi:hypothetical protein